MGTDPISECPVGRLRIHGRKAILEVFDRFLPMEAFVRLAKVLFVGAALAATGAAHAFGIGARAGTTGVGADVGWNLAPALNARLGYSALRWSHDVSTSDVRYDGKVKLSNLSGLVDFTPLGPLFRLTGGVIYNDNKYDVHGQPSIGGSLDGTVKAGRRLAPYLGIGWGNVAGAGINFYADLGIMFMGSPKASLNANCGSALSASACAQLQGEAAAEQARLEDKLEKFRYYPVLNLGLTIGF